MRGFLVVEVCANVADVGIGETHNLAGVAGIGENFLVAGEAGVENDFAAAARGSACGPPVKDAPVLEREDRGTCGWFGQRDLHRDSWDMLAGRRDRAEMIHGPVGKYGFAVNV